MAEYIEREAITRISFTDAVLIDGEVRTERIVLVRDIEKLPAADVAPVRHGRWEIVVGSNGKEYMVCTVCRVSQDLTGVFSYCPNCGAKMEGERKENENV